MHNYFKQFLKNESGSVAPIFAGSVIPILFLAGAAMDYSFQAKNRTLVSNVADAAVLQISHQALEIVDNAVDDEAIKTDVTALLDPLLTASLSEVTNMSYSIDGVEFDETTSQLNIDIKVSQDTTFMSLAKVDSLDSIVKTGVTLSPPTQNALSVAFVLDKSGSMGWNGRWSTLTTAMNSLKNKFKELDPDKKYIRTGLTMFDYSGYSFYGMKWNMQKTVNKLNNYMPGGGTNSAPAMLNAYNYLKTDHEDVKHKNRNDSVLRKVIIFMTDGVNNRKSSDTSTKAYCTLAKDMGIEIYSISFGATGRGKTMLEDCSSGANYFILANNNAELIEAFDMIGESIGKEAFLSQ